MSVLPIAAAAAGGLLLIFWLTALLNSVTFPRLRLPFGRAAEVVPVTERVSILIPARNEAARLGATLAALQVQSVREFELIVLDDNSDDGTADIVRDAAESDPRLRLIQGRPLPDGWLGKNWACHQLAQAATGDTLIFTDADVHWSPNALFAVLHEIRSRRPDLLTVWPTQQTDSWAERLVIPGIWLAVLAYLPLPAVHYLPWPAFAAANGQCMAFRRDAYAAIGGHAAVRDAIVEDVALARRVKRAGRRLRMALGNRMISCRMYDGWPDVRDGLAKNILVGHGGFIPMTLSLLMHWLVFLWPWLWLAFGRDSWGWPGAPLSLVLAGVGLRAFTAWLGRSRPLDALGMPLTVLLYTRITLQAMAWRRRGQIQWKGRTVG